MTRKSMINLIQCETSQEVVYVEDLGSKVEFFNSNYELLGVFNRKQQTLLIGCIQFSDL